MVNGGGVHTHTHTHMHMRVCCCVWYVRHPRVRAPGQSVYSAADPQHGGARRKRIMRAAPWLVCECISTHSLWVRNIARARRPFIQKESKCKARLNRNLFWCEFWMLFHEHSIAYESPCIYWNLNALNKMRSFHKKVVAIVATVSLCKLHVFHCWLRKCNRSTCSFKIIQKFLILKLK